MANVITDLGFGSLSKVLIAPVTVATATTTNGTGVDVSTATGPYTIVVAVGAVSGTNPTLDIKLQESDVVGSGYTDVPGATVRQLVTADAAGVYFGFAKKALKPFVRAVAVTGGTPSFAFGVLLFAEPKSVGNPDTKGFSTSPAA